MQLNALLSRSSSNTGHLSSRNALAAEGMRLVGCRSRRALTPRSIALSGGTFVYAYDKRMCYFDTLMEKF